MTKAELECASVVLDKSKQCYTYLEKVMAQFYMNEAAVIKFCLDLGLADMWVYPTFVFTGIIRLSAETT